MASDQDLQTARTAFAEAVARRGDAVLAAWRVAIAADPAMKPHPTLTRTEIEDHLPRWLRTFARALALDPADPATGGVVAAEAETAEAHGHQRWQQGFDLHEVMREWSALNRCLVDEIERLVLERPDLPAAVARDARACLAHFIGESTSQSAKRYFDLARVESSGNLRDLEEALRRVGEIEKAQAELWRQAAHDLRGNLGVVANVASAATGSDFASLPPARREHLFGILSRNVDSLHHLLDDVTELARLGAAQEERRVETFDVAALLRSLCADVAPLARDKPITVVAEGPRALAVRGDAVKVRRIAQNLVLNAIRYTVQGSVVLAFGEGEGEEAGSWWFEVADTGPGLASGADLAGARPGDGQPQGEGIGLAIVKRLTELLEAHLEIDTDAGRGTTFRIVLPLRYPDAG